MTFRDWVQALGFDADDLTPHRRSTLQALYDSNKTGPPPVELEGPHPSPAEARRLAAARLAAGDAELTLVSDPDAVQILFAEKAADDAADGETKLPRFEMLAYTGGALRLMGWFFPVVIDLKGLAVSRRARPVLKEHDRTAVVGHTDKISKENNRLQVTGVISGTGEAAQEVVSTSKNKFPWRASLGARADKMVFVEGGKTASANGQEFKGPVYIARKATLGEISFVTLAADDKTAANVAASQGGHRIEVHDMDFETWLKAKGFDPAEISDSQRASLEAMYKADIEPPKVPVTPPEAPPNAPAGDAEPDVQAAAAAAVTAERQRISTIEGACKGFDEEQIADLRAQAMSGEIGLDALQAKLLDLLRAERPTPPAAGTPPQVDKPVLLAAAYRAGGFEEKRIIELTSEQALEAADRRLRGVGFEEYCAQICALDGVQLGRYQSDPTAWLQAAFSTGSLPGILANVANKSLLQAYKYTEQTWRQVCSIGNVKDFKQHTRYRLGGNFKFLKVGPDGEIQHGELTEQSFTQQADTFGIMFGMTRQDIINDDLGAFMAVPQLLGRGAGDAINSAVWTLVLSNPSSFFHANNSNYASGATTALSIGSMTTAETLFLDQTKPDGTPLGIPPAVLLVPTALKVTGEQLYKDRMVNETTTANKPKVNSNPHAGKFEVACSAYLANSSYTGYSALAWYLFADPRVLAAFEVAFLNGVDRPTVQRADANFNTLGVEFRGYIDFGVKEQDPRAAAKMKGEA